MNSQGYAGFTALFKPPGGVAITDAQVLGFFFHTPAPPPPPPTPRAPLAPPLPPLPPTVPIPSQLLPAMWAWYDVSSFTTSRWFSRAPGGNFALVRGNVTVATDEPRAVGNSGRTTYVRGPASSYVEFPEFYGSPHGNFSICAVSR